MAATMLLGIVHSFERKDTPAQVLYTDSQKFSSAFLSITFDDNNSDYPDMKQLKQIQTYDRPYDRSPSWEILAPEKEGVVKFWVTVSRQAMPQSHAESER